MIQVLNSINTQINENSVTSKIVLFTPIFISKIEFSPISDLIFRQTRV